MDEKEMIEVDIENLKDAYKRLKETLNDLKDVEDFSDEQYQLLHSIAEDINDLRIEKEKQIIIDRLRVNLDGNTNACIYEVKTHKSEKDFKVSKQYWRQA